MGEGDAVLPFSQTPTFKPFKQKKVLCHQHTGHRFGMTYIT